ncbi:Poly(3-hydroxyalkanoate) synthetase [alpha proteobacterium BAL199]|jgi:polyhydroxyalkanoate synthase subunit PhaC|nr:Poly(3-hydroxyalkanoate) synthetase [alpha proteobacterium BAL199]
MATQQQFLLQPIDKAEPCTVRRRHEIAMTKSPDPQTTPPDPMELSRTMASIAERSQRIVQEFLEQQNRPAGDQDALGISDPMNIGNAFLEMTSKMMADPAKLLQAQFGLWQDYMTLWQATTSRIMGGSGEAVAAPERGDKRFKDGAWEESFLFDYIKQTYLLTARWMQKTVGEVEGLDDKTHRKVDFYTKQFVDAMAPSNFALSNPEVLRTTIETGGENLVKGLQNLVSDLERGHGKLDIQMTDQEAFEVGVNVGTTPGKVIYENELMQLIQYSPTTETVMRRPLLLVPPWINKFYILDLRAKNSFIRWAVEQGITVFVVSWVNPDAQLAEKTFEDYMLEGPLAALDAIEKATGEREVNAIGYCIGGTLMASTVAWMAAKGDDRIKSITFFTTMIDFAEAGDLSVFIDEEQLTALEDRMSKTGYLDGRAMATTFNMLRANDLIWSFVINNYLMGKEPFPFDLLYWNSDSTRMPAAMHSFYLRRMYQQNDLVKPGCITLAGTPIDLSNNRLPTFVLSTKEDHIAPWKSTYAATQVYKGPVKFCLAGSGHIAGVINPPANPPKYGYWTRKGKAPKDPEKWLETAQQTDGSWWPEWASWLGKYAGGKVPARVPGDHALVPIEDAPGRYVKARASE